MSFSIIRLNSLILKWDEKEIRSLLSTFSCSAEPDAERFLKKMAIRFEKDSISRTYLLIAESVLEKSPPVVKGFFTLTIKCLSMNEQYKVPENLRSKMNISNGIAQAYLLGQLAKADDTERGIGRDMITRALGTFSKGKEMFGCRVVRLDCKDKLIDYYESCGFSLSGKNSDGMLNQMVIII